MGTLTVPSRIATEPGDTLEQVRAKEHALTLLHRDGAPVERWKDVLVDAMMAATGLTKLYERSDASTRALEGMEPATGWLRGDGATDLTIQESFTILLHVPSLAKTTRRPPSASPR